VRYRHRSLSPSSGWSTSSRWSGDVYVAIENWIEGQGLEIAAAPRETYWTDFYSAAADDEVFDVAFPVR
jgi:effector-binding domain-containing protein